MVLTRFPDIEMVRRLRNEPSKPSDKWMNVALNIKCRQASRTGVESPYSLFLNKKGFSYCTVNKRHYRVETDTFLFTEPGDIYDLTIDNTEHTEICNIHINKEFFDKAFYTITTPSAQQLNNPMASAASTRQLFTQLHTKDASINSLTDRLTQLSPDNTISFELILFEIIEYLACSNEEIRKKISTLPFIKTNVREDIYKRLSVARDYIHANYNKPIDLDELCIETGMSKFHFLRMFKSLYGITPYQYLTAIRMKKAAALLKTSDRSITDIAGELGFEYPNSLIKAFRKTYNEAPLQYRKNIWLYK